MRKPNLFIVGAPKAGSSLLWQALKNHPEIFFSNNPEKEINYFSFEELDRYSYYKDFKIRDIKKYLSLFRMGQTAKYLVDGSVSYFSFISVAKKIYKFNSDAKIVVIVRDPKARAYSHYNMDKRMGYADKPFLEYLNNKENIYDKHIHQYIQNSLYYKHVNNYSKYFGKNQLFVMQLEKIENDIIRLCKFLDIDPIDFDFNNKVNENKTPKNIISKTLQHNRYLATILKRFIPRKVVKVFDPLFYKKAEIEPMSDLEMKLLDEYLKDDFLRFKKKYLT